MNAREQLKAVAEWFGYQEESLSFGLVNTMDALRLYDFAQSHPDLPEMADDWTSRDRITALGYDPLKTPEATKGREVVSTGAQEAISALVLARELLDSVAYVAKEGDTSDVLKAIDSVLHEKKSKARKGS